MGEFVRKRIFASLVRFYKFVLSFHINLFDGLNKVERNSVCIKNKPLNIPL